MKNPARSRDELILALDLYFREPSARGSKSHPEVINLSDLLNHLPIHPGAHPGATFRNPNGVGMKLSNFLRYDPSYEGKGLERGAKREEAFASDNEHLRRVAEAIRSNYWSLVDAPLADEKVITDEDEAPEGRVLTRVH